MHIFKNIQNHWYDLFWATICHCLSIPLNSDNSTFIELYDINWLFSLTYFGQSHVYILVPRTWSLGVVCACCGNSSGIPKQPKGCPLREANPGHHAVNRAEGLCVLGTGVISQGLLLRAGPLGLKPTGSQNGVAADELWAAVVNEVRIAVLTWIWRLRDEVRWLLPLRMWL